MGQQLGLEGIVPPEPDMDDAGLPRCVRIERWARQDRDAWEQRCRDVVLEGRHAQDVVIIGDTATFTKLRRCGAHDCVCTPHPGWFAIEAAIREELGNLEEP